MTDEEDEESDSTQIRPNHQPSSNGSAFQTSNHLPSTSSSVNGIASRNARVEPEVHTRSSRALSTASTTLPPYLQPDRGCNLTKIDYLLEVLDTIDPISKPFLKNDQY
uniref:Uncharacterized protein n=1 Tax=Ditylenchus dipsaci TaxID=166011 RepID=A0A915DDU5_9BILA